MRRNIFLSKIYKNLLKIRKNLNIKIMNLFFIKKVKESLIMKLTHTILLLEI